MEIEVKFRYKEGVEEKVQKIAEFVIEKVEEDIYFNHPCRDFRESDEALRVRRDVEGIKVTYKGPKIDAETKSREEIKLIVDDYNKAVAIFLKLGFKKVRNIRKTRRIYRIDEAIVCIDEVDGLGKFVEIEIESDSLEAKEKVFQIAEMLGYLRSEAITESYLEMIERYSSQNP